MLKPSVIDSPSGRLPKKAFRWDRGRTETCGGGKVSSGGSLLVWEYLGIYRSGIRSNGVTRGPQAQAARLPPWGLPLELMALSDAFWSPPEASRVPSGLEKINLNIFFRLDFV
jgi:hypothetical protein